MTNLPVLRKWAWLLVVSALALVSTSGSDARRAEIVRAQVQNTYRSMPLSFEANQGQTDPDVKFLSRGARHNLFLTDREAVIALRRPNARPSQDSPAVLRMMVVGAASAPVAMGQEELPGRNNYLLGNDPGRWQTDVRQYAKVRYAGVYQGIDLVYYGNQGQLEYDFVVSAGADPQQIQLAWSGTRGLRVSDAGDLVVAIDGGEIVQHKPVIYQEVDGAPHEVAGGYRLAGQDRVTFDLGTYDRSRRLVIDPVLSFATYLGGSAGALAPGGDEDDIRIAVDNDGHAYLFGTTSSDDFPTTNGSQLLGSNDLFVTKLNQTGTGVEYSTYLGGSSVEISFGIAVDSSGQAYLTGFTQSPDFPVTPGVFQPSKKPGFADAFVTKLSPDGTGLIYSSYLGGSDTDHGTAIAIDDDGAAYVAGATFSSDFPIGERAYKTVPTGTTDLFVTKVNPTGTALLYSTYLGGAGSESTVGIAVDDYHQAVVVGQADSSDFPTTAGAAMPAFRGGSIDGFVTKFNPDASALVYSTFIGGSGPDSTFKVALDRRGRAHVTGYTCSLDFPVTPDAFQPARRGACDAFVATVSRDGTAFEHGSYLGGSGVNGVANVGTGIAVDDDGRVHVAGTTTASDFPVTPDAFRSTGLGDDAFVTVVDWDAGSLVFSTYLGGSNAEGGPTGIALDKRGDAYVAGRTWSGDFPTTPGAFQPSLAPGSRPPGCGRGCTPIGDAYVVKIEYDHPPDTSISSSPAALTTSTSAFFTFTSSEPVSALTGFECSLDGAPFGACNSPVTYSGLAEGSHTFDVRAVTATLQDPTPASFTWMVDHTGPVITLSAKDTSLSPANARFVVDVVTGQVQDAVSGVDPATVAFRVVDEYQALQPAGRISPGAGGTFLTVLWLEARRLEQDSDGRRYELIVTATDEAGNQSSASVIVTVPHDPAN